MISGRPTGSTRPVVRVRLAQFRERVAHRERDDQPLRTGSGGHPHPRRNGAQARGECLLEQERGMEARQVAGEPVGGPAEGVIGVARRGAAVGAASVGGQERLEIAVGDERLDLVAVASRLSRRSPRRVVEIARDAAQGAVDEDPDGALGAAQDAGDLRGRHLVDEAQDQRPATIVGEAADRRPGRRDLVLSRRVAFDVDGAGDRAGRLERRFRAATQACGAARRRRCARSGRARPGRSRRPRHRPGARAPRTGRGSSGRRGTCARWRPPPRDGRAARRRRSCTPGPGTSDRGPRTGPGPPGPPRRAVGHGRGGRDADHPPPDGPPS